MHAVAGHFGHKMASNLRLSQLSLYIWLWSIYGLVILDGIRPLRSMMQCDYFLFI